MKLIGNIEHGLALPHHAFCLAVVHHGRRKQAQAGMAMLFVVPTKESLTKSTAVLDASEAVRELRPILHGAELAFRVRIIIRNMGVVAHTVYPPIEPWILKVINYNAFDESKSEYVAKRLGKDDRSHMPIAELGLRSDENYYLYVGKERPLIVVRGIGSRWLSPLYDESLYACAPIFTFKPRHNDAFRIKTMGSCYPSLFYLPSDANGCTDEGAARFELIQPIARKALHNYFKGSPSRPVALSDEAFALFVNHLGRFLLSKDLDPQVCEQMDAYQSLVLEELQKNPLPKR